ncbi:MAG: addiction module protein [Hyphomicrobium sp.]|nr:addiction module protein [Hyphomicrobium sp.]
MNPTVDDLVAQAERLSLEERALLLDRLLQIVPHGIDPDVEKAWIEEAERRWDAIESGEMKTVPWQEVRKGLGLV